MSRAPRETKIDSLQFSCGYCQAQLAVPVALAGVTGPCPHCEKAITAPLPVERPCVVDPVPKVARVRTHSTGIGLFEKKGFRMVRGVLSVAACVVIFMAFQALKSRRWELPGRAGQTAQAPAATPTVLAEGIEQETNPDHPAIQGVTPPALPNLRTLSAGP